MKHYLRLSVNETRVSSMPAAQRPPSPDFERLHGQIVDTVDALSPQLRRAARSLLAHPDRVAVQTIRETAEQADVTPATLVRLAKTLGLPGYPALKRAFLDRALAQGDAGRLPYRAKAAELQALGGDATLHERLHARQLANLEGAKAANTPELFQRCAGRLAEARRVWIAGFRSLYPVAFHMHYVWGFFRRDLFLAAAPGGAIDNGAFEIGRDDALFVTSVSPYSRNAMVIAEAAAAARATIVALTDSAASPLAKLTPLHLVAPTETPSFFHSLTAVGAVAETLLALLAARGGKDVLAAIARTQKRLGEMGTYIDPIARKQT
jgi:DNA-binding MurR/RpiR family transcriptional regulator